MEEQRYVATRVQRSSDCGNSPKQKLLEDMSVALASADLELVKVLSVPELVWTHIGKKPAEGQDSVISAIRQTGAATEITIERVVSHGRAGAVNGVIERDGKRMAFCHMFEFNNAKCTHFKSVTTYLVGLR